MKLQKKIVVITGASKGLGKALAHGFVRAGATVLISARAKARLQTAARETGATAFPADVTKERDLVRLAQYARRRFGRIDIWINNAGITIPQAPLEAVDARAARRVMDVNFFGTFNGVRAVLPILKRQRRGAIVNIVSISALLGRPPSLVYSASKWAVRGFTEGLRMSLAPTGILVCAVHPGGMKTTIFGKHVPQGYDQWMDPAIVAEKVIKNLQRKVPKTEIVVTKTPVPITVTRIARYV